MQIQKRATFDYNGNVPIQHPISKLDTLAGVAIKYGVEVADIKKMNGLVTDRQMFALKTLHIPQNGKHPSSPYSSSSTGHDNDEYNSPDNGHCEVFESFLSPVISSLRGYYGAKPTMKKSASEIFNIEEYEKRCYKGQENGSFSRNSVLSPQHVNRHQKSRSLANGTLDDIMEGPDIMEVIKARKSDTDKRKSTLIRRNHKSEANLQRIPEMLLKKDNGNNGAFSTRSSKGLAQRQKAGSRIALDQVV
uniref:LysM and putative peptidoglycan-binding domain-containing protein 1 n=1 Tax=Cajanus cajan TaxID=3821 RepID=A0A151TMZ9_CAJCA|nr:LysM and putative peptidoglycan-binding domain-containing protein 1 [Cajanus cajan]